MPRSRLAPTPRPIATLLLALGCSTFASADEPRPKPAPITPPPSSSPAESTPLAPDDDGKGNDIETGRPRRAGPVVRSAEATADLLRDPGEDPYAGPINWRHVPPWEQTSFYNVRARGTFFVFVVDCSGSMADDLRLYRAKQELRRCIGSLRFPQRYLVIFYNDRPIPMAGGVPRSADQRGKMNTFSWINSVDALGGTDPRGAMNLALGLRPDAVFLLSDGEFPAGTESGIAKTNAGRTPIHCIDLAGGLGADQLRAIAEDSGGQYALRR